MNFASIAVGEHVHRMCSHESHEHVHMNFASIAVGEHVHQCTITSVSINFVTSLKT
jgi:hypothetical protein